MTNIKCPFCQQELKCWDEPQDAIYSNWSCPNCRRFAYGNKLIWQELIRTRKALEVAKEGLKSAHEYYQNCIIREKQPQEINWYCTAMNMDNDISEVLEQISALEQKDVK